MSEVESRVHFQFEKLNVWVESKNLAKQIYLITDSFPNDEKFGLTNQIRRAVVSVSSNIVEGNARVSSKDKSHFFTMAYSSLMELTSQLIISEELGFLSSSSLSNLIPQIENVAKMLSGLKRKLTDNNLKKL